MENKKIIKIIVFSILLNLIMAPITAIGLKVNSSDGEEPEVMMFEDRHVTIKLRYLEMLDNIDWDIGQGDNKYADFRYKIWVFGGIDGNGDDYWEVNLPDDIKKLDNVNKEHEWSIGDKDEVEIKIALWDRDLLGEEYCDINGDSIDVHNVRFKYDVVKNTYALSGTGGYVAAGEVYFDGTLDGSDGTQYPEDDNDACISIVVIDDYSRPPYLELTDENTYFGKVKVGESKSQDVCTLFNTGEITATGNIYLSDGDLEDFTITYHGGDFSIEPNHGIYVEVTFAPKSSGNKDVVLTVDGDDPCNEHELKLTAVAEKSVSRELLLYQFLSHFPLLERILHIIHL